MWTCVIAFEETALEFFKYSFGSSFLSLMSIRMTRKVFLCEFGVSGTFRATQKSSASLPDRYPCRVIGVEYDLPTCFPFPFSPSPFVDSELEDCLSASLIVGFERHTNCGVSVGFGFGSRTVSVVAVGLVGVGSLGKFRSYGCNPGNVIGAP